MNQMTMIIVICLTVLVGFCIEKYKSRTNYIEDKYKFCHSIHGLFLCINCDFIHDNPQECPMCNSKIFITLPKLIGTTNEKIQLNTGERKEI